MLTKEKFLPTRISYRRKFIFIFLLLLVYLLGNSPIISKHMTNFTFNYIFMPVLWTSIAFSIWSFPHIRPKGSLRLRSLINLWAFIFAIIFIIIGILVGLIDGLGKSPYSSSFLGMLTNIVFIGSALIGREFIRSYLVNSFTKKESYLVFISIALLMTFTNISFIRYRNIEDTASLVRFIAEAVGPEFSESLFASYLVYLGGPLSSIIYLATVEGFHWLSPVLPDLKWITTALVGILLPIFFMMAMQRIYFIESKEINRREHSGEGPVGWIITSLISIGIIWFAVGVFPTYPSVIATGSMEPMIKPGDVILVKKIIDMEGINNLKINDVIQFKRDDILISHRIMDISNNEEEGLGFITKGDNNSSVDFQKVKPEDIRGTIVYTVLKIGWPTLLIKSDKDIDLDKIQF